MIGIATAALRPYGGTTKGPNRSRLAELKPWVEQWQNEVDQIYNLAAFTREQLTQRMTQVGKSLEELAAWRPEPATRGRKTKST